MTEPNFAIDRHRLRAIVEAGEASSAALKATSEKLKDAQYEAREALRDLDDMKARKASKPRYLDFEIEQAEKARHEAAVTASQASYQGMLDALQAAQGKYTARKAIAAEAIGLARACEDFAASRGVRV